MLKIHFLNVCKILFLEVKKRHYIFIGVPNKLPVFMVFGKQVLTLADKT